MQFVSLLAFWGKNSATEAFFFLFWVFLSLKLDLLILLGVSDLTNCIFKF